MSIHDQFTDMNVSRQRKYQMRHHVKGLCLKCGASAMEGFVHCEKHHKWLLASRPTAKRSSNTKYNRLKGKA